MKLEPTFMHFLLEHQQRNNRTLNFVILMESILTASEHIQYYYLSGALQRTLGEAGKINVQGENVMSMDLMAHEIGLHYRRECNQVIEVTSEESEEAIPLNENGRYIVYFDPLDGSSNVKHSLPVGFLFGIAKRNLDGPEDCHLRTGRELIAAGMFLIPAGLFTFSLKNAGTWRFIKDETGGYCRPTKIHLPDDPKSWELSWNSANRATYAPAVRKWLEDREPNHSFRYAGALAVDFHRLLGNGGLFAYPAIMNHPDEKKNRPDGKLRLLYETAVVSFMAQEAGGFAVDEYGEPVLDIRPESRHQRSALYVGNKSLVTEIQHVLRREAASRRALTEKSRSE